MRVAGCGTGIYSGYHPVLVDMIMVFDGMVVLVGLSYHCDFPMVGQNEWYPRESSGSTSSSVVLVVLVDCQFQDRVDQWLQFQSVLQTCTDN